MLQNVVRYPGVRGFESATYTCSIGITPSQVLVAAFPPFDGLAKHGDCELSDGQRSILIPDCALVRVEGQQRGSPDAITIVLVDHRWRWQFGYISGRYNVPEFQPTTIPLVTDVKPAPAVPAKPGEEPIQKRTRKSARELAKLCLEAMGEQNHRVDAVPDDVFPTIDWDGINPAYALQALVEPFGLVIVWRNAERAVWICKRGEGERLPDGAMLGQGEKIDDRVKPRSIMVLTGRIRFQQRFELEPVGRDFDGVVRPLDELSYRRVDGDWGVTGPEGAYNLGTVFLPAGRTAEDARALARSCIRKYWRIKDDDLWIPIDGQDNYRNKKQRHQVRLLPFLNQTFKDEFGRLHQGNARVMGVHTRYYRLTGRPAASLDGPLAHHSGTSPDTPVEIGFSINADEGLVVFSAPVWLIQNGKYEFPDLVLECCCEVTDNAANFYRRDYVERMIPGGADTEPLVIVKDDILSTVTATYHSNPVTATDLERVRDNLPEVEQYANPIIDAELKRFELDDAGDKTYTGLRPIYPDGAIQQVTWSVGGGSVNNPSTRASRQTEHNLNVPLYPQRRQNEDTRPALNQLRINNAISTGVKSAIDVAMAFRKTE